MRKSDNPPADPLATALRMLGRRPYSVADLRRNLERKCGKTGRVAEAITRLRQLGYLDDKKFAAQAASSLVINRSFGRYRIRRELKARLVDYNHIEPALDQAFGEVSERELLERVLEKKVRTLKLPVTRSKLHSLCQSLVRRGFRPDDIMSAVRSRPELRPIAEDAVEIELESPSE